MNTLFSHSHRNVRIWLVAAGLSLATLGGFALYRYESTDRLVLPTVLYKQPTLTSTAPVLTWPNYGQAAVATADDGIVAVHGITTPQPTASTAKLITMLAVMEKKPFAVGSQGPILTLTQADVDIYSRYVGQNGSNVRVEAEETVTQYQAAQGVLLASSDNLADSLAIWAFGSLPSYRDYATKMLARYGLHDTTVGRDASGLDPSTTSTAHDLAVIATHVLAQPILAQITSQQSAELPLVGTIHNTNILLGSEGVVGLKTGYTGYAGGVFVLAANQVINGYTHQIITVVMGADVSKSAQYDSYALYQSARQAFTYVTIASKNQTVGSYHAPWESTPHEAVVSDDLGLFVWLGAPPKVTVLLNPVKPSDSTGSVGQLTVTTSGGHTLKGPVKLQQPVSEPHMWWRIVGRPLTL